MQSLLPVLAADVIGIQDLTYMNRSRFVFKQSRCRFTSHILASAQAMSSLYGTNGGFLSILGIQTVRGSTLENVFCLVTLVTVG